MFGSRTGCSTLLTLQSAQLFGVLSDRRFGPLHLRSESLLFIGELAGVDAGCLRGFLCPLRFSRQLVQLAGSTCSLALGHAQRVSQALAAGVLVQLLTQISCALLGALERGSCPLRRLAGTTQANRQALSAFGLVQLLGQLLACVADLIQIFGNLSGFRRQLVLAPEYVLNQAVFNRHASNSGQ